MTKNPFIALETGLAKHGLTVGSLAEWAITSDHGPLDTTLAVAAWEDAATPAAAVRRQGRPRARFVHAEWTRYAHQVGEQRVAAVLDANTAALLAGSISSSEAVATLSGTLRKCLALAFPVGPTALPLGADYWDQSCTDALEQLRSVLRAPHRHGPGAVKAARNIYYPFIKSKRQAFRRHRLQQQTTAYFDDSKSFFRGVQPTRKKCPIQDIDGFRAHFERVSNTPVNSASGDNTPVMPPDHVFRRTVPGSGQRFMEGSVVVQRRVAAAHLNETFAAGEVAAVIAALNNHKAADPGGLVAELFKYAR
ncbi:MAG: hypothetical protein WDW38_007028 [Sanguina aurantia]